VLTGREQPSRQKACAVLVAIAGTALVMLGDGQLQADGVGVILALGSAVACALWVLISDRVVQGVPALTVSALMSTGAALTLCAGALMLGAVELGFGPIGWGAVVGTVIFSTVVAISTSLAGVARVGPTVASVLLTVEVPLAVTWSIVLLGESLRETQIVGASLIVAAVLLLQVRTLRWPAWIVARYAPRDRTVGQPRRPT
jgi:drug/metabolite transporter (DMT)-like permease